MQKYIGADVTSMVTLPVIIFEPMTMLQKMAEVCAFFFMPKDDMFVVFNNLYSVLMCKRSMAVTVDGILPPTRSG